MLLVYLSLGGNVRRFVRATGMESAELSYSDPLTEVNEDFILIVPSYDDEITDLASEFVGYKNNLEHLVAVVGSGNMNFGDKGYCFNARAISNKFRKPLIFMFEHSGDNDIIEFKKEVDKVEIARTK